MIIRIWGTRGSIPAPSTSNFATWRYGGNTTCLSVRVPGLILIFDGGSGLRPLGLELAREMPIHAHFFFSHVHWDHIQGFPFFVPAFVEGNEFDLYGPTLDQKEGFVAGILEKALRGQQEDLNFPVSLADMPAKMRFHDLRPGGVVRLKGSETDVSVAAGLLNHPGGCFGYRVEERTGKKTKIFVFATDTEHLRNGANRNLQKLARGADCLYYDAQYSDDEYEGRKGISRVGWGHSTWTYGIEEARKAGVRRLLLGHHDPMHDDSAVALLENAARKAGLRVGIEVDAAYEGMEIDI
ncbi:MAG: MBL fold metallo-hydrolase [Planctomycetota bacterium]|nr:MBL fold metallo-hydrolase [Planctomycetota bacterium]